MTNKGFLSGMDLQVLFKVKSLRINEKAADWATFVIRPVIIHVDVEVIEVAKVTRAFDAVEGPHVILDLIFIVTDGAVVVGGVTLDGGHGLVGGGHHGLGEAVQGQLCAFFRVDGNSSRSQYCRHLSFLLLDQPGERKWQAEVREAWVEDRL